MINFIYFPFFNTLPAIAFNLLSNLRSIFLGEVMMALSNGSSELTDTVYHDRFNHVPELNRLGADIKIEKNMAIIKGVSNLIGAPVMSTDIRASASLILGGLFAEGLTEVNRVYHIDRGYENIEEKFSKLGANIQRVSS